ncbi:Transposon TX1 uncharacterized 149 kDa protein ORF 2 [Takifugu flavidus]|uniref:Transposon TX1 uncharacterized 149 kDa protein ORF 2 n=1 Tax=Takifugu flavidus TaxID=433684 RepID=A0A5C6MG19_9TELE|nr:Transposon TX1 uncharacterized 149 kDa protein ORF 2 [Takifugu flavidus]
MAANAGLTGLSRKHGVKVGAGSELGVEEVALAVGQKIGHSSIKFAAHMNRQRDWKPDPNRRNKRKSAMKDKGGKTGRLEETAADTDTSDCESMSDGSELSGTMPEGQEIDLYPPGLFKKFLTQTKGMKGTQADQETQKIVRSSGSGPAQSLGVAGSGSGASSSEVGAGRRSLNQETHSDCGIEADWEKEWEGQVLLSHNTTLSGGVGLLFSRGFTLSSLEVEHVVRGRCLMVKDTRRSIKDLEMEIAELEAIGSSTGDQKNGLGQSGQELVEPGQIRQRAVEFFSSLYESEYCRDNSLFHQFCGDLPQVSEEANSRLDRPLKLDELHAVLLSMKGRKSPGVDGLTEFFKAYWDIVAHDMLEVFNESLASGSLPLSCRRAVVTLLP